MSRQVRITNEYPDALIAVRVQRQDVAPGEPNSLLAEHLLFPNETVLLPVQEGGALLLTREPFHA